MKWLQWYKLFLFFKRFERRIKYQFYDDGVFVYIYYSEYLPNTTTEKYLIAHGVPSSTYFPLQPINLDAILLHT